LENCEYKIAIFNFGIVGVPYTSHMGHHQLECARTPPEASINFKKKNCFGPGSNRYSNSSLEKKKMLVSLSFSALYMLYFTLQLSFTLPLTTLSSQFHEFSSFLGPFTTGKYINIII
jgi:hypothetical protein